MSGTKQSNNNIQFKNPSRIIGIQFGMLSPEEIRKGVVEVVSKDTYINNKEVPGGLFDPRMGVLGHGSVCPTDGLTYINTPGYFGYIELARPVFFIQHIKDIMSILKCVCFKCSKLLISKEDHKHIINMKASDRWSYVYKKCSGINRCGEATELGCGCKQPDKIKLEEMATIIATWENLGKTDAFTGAELMTIIESPEKAQFTMRFTPEIVLKIFKRISDEDVNFMGFSPIWSRPDWMVCQALPVAPPSVRPSVKQDANQRSEDDLTHIYGHIIKTNKDLEERINNNAAPHVVDGLTKVLQYFVAMIANNKVKGAVPMAQRSGRPLQCITDRINSKNGRIRGNLMGKRVDFSARSVITGDPNLSAKQLGVPKKVAMNLTKPVVVNDRNRNFLTKLVQNGPDVYPGAKNLEKKNGDTISLRYRDRMSIRLENGDVVHRHMMDGDPVLFNRQPSLHRMSMMCHIAKIMDKGDTFRMNVCDTKPYNADFDGDEMNMHMPQNVLSETELRHLAAIPYQIISPSSNSPIIGIYQDSMLGTYRFTRPDIEFSPREAMNILMGFSRVDVASLAGKKKITSFDILSQITPPLTLKTKTKQYDDKADDYATSNNVLEILNGKYVRGQMIASTVKGVLNRVCNDFGHLACSDYIDDLQQVITEYMKTSAYSVGVSDLISDKRTTDEILQVIAAKKSEVQQLTDKIHLGIFENKTGNANSVEYENQVKGILNKATDQTGTIAKKSLDANNRFLIMVASGSKGNMVNISQMISCLGQQSVDGKRVPYGFDNRTLPHFSKYDDSPGARGFVENSYISGLTAPELFFHAMGGRMGLIDTAVKTSQTGYIQRRLVKGLEDLKVEYDMTVRNNMGKIIQFSYGEDGAETTRIENQSIPIVGMSVEQIYMHYDIVGMNEGDHELIKIYTKGAATRIRKQREETQALCKKYIDYMINVRDELVENVFKFKNEDSVKTPVAFHHLIMNAHGQFGLTGNSTVDITPLEAFQMIEAKFETLKLSGFSKPTKMFEILYFYYLSPKDLLVNKRFNKKMLEILLESIHLNFKKSIVSPGEMVGVIAGQSIGEPTTQMSLTRNECIKIVKMVGGKPNMMSVKIGDFCDQIIEENPSMTFGTGHENSVETILGEDHEYYIMGVNANETTQWSKISHVSRHPVNGELMRIKTKSGRTVETTTSHSHLVRRDNKVQAIVGKDMKVGMRVPVSKNIENTFVNDKIQISGKDYELNRLFGWFIGAYLAEGSINYNTICITNISDVFKQNTIAFAELFGKTCKVYEKESEYGHTTDIKFTCAELADFLKITCGNGSYVKCVPDFAFVAPMEFKSSMIQSYMDGDGNIQCDSGHHMIRVCSRSHQLIKDFALIINYFGIFGSINTTFTRSADLHHLSISAKYAGLYKLHIGSSLDYKMDALNRLVEYENRDNAHNLSDEMDKINGLGDIIAHCGKTLKLENHSAFYGRWANKESIGRRTLQKYIGVFENNVNVNLIGDQLTILKQAASSDVVWDEIVEITILKGTDEFVYDFTVPTNQTFLTDYGVYVHNTLNSVTFETEIIVKNSQGIIKKVQIGDFTNEYINKATKTEYYADKDTTYAELEDYFEVPSCNEEGKCSWDRIEAVTRHPVLNKDGTNVMLKITTKEQREVIVTKAKSLLKLVDGKIVGVDGDCLKVGDYIPVSNKMLEFTETTVLPLKTILPPTDYIYSSEVEKAKSVMNEYHWWLKHNGKLFVIPYNRSDSFVSKMNLNKIKKGCKTKTEIKLGCVYTKQTSMNSYNIPEEIELTYNFGYFVGAYAAEGCMTHSQVSISNNDAAYFAPIEELCKEWNITTKIYRNENKNQSGWVSQDIRIYNTLMCHILEILCGKLSHNKFVSDIIAYSNKECIRGFLDAYIGGDGTVSKKNHSILMNSVSKQLLVDVQQMMNLLGIYSFILKFKKPETNNRGSNNIKQCYQLNVVNKQAAKLAALLAMKTTEKQKTCDDYVLNYKHKYEYGRAAKYVPNCLDGVIVSEDRNGRFEDVLFDKIISIEEVANTTPYAYDLTVANTRNFNLHNGICARDTFHLAGVASKSNVTRGVPRIEEILRLTRNPDKPSVTIYMKPQDQHDKDKATNYCNMIQYTKLIDVVKSVEICFDPNDRATKIHSDAALIDQFYLFDELAKECNETDEAGIQLQRSKWVVRMEIDAESLLEKNITMDDIHFAISTVHGNEVSCIYSDMNSSNLVFRIRINASVLNRNKKKVSTNAYSEALDQSDEIYLLKNFQDTVINNIVLRGVNKIVNVIPRIVKDMVVKEDGKYSRKEAWVLDTTGSNLIDVFGVDFIDFSRTYSNDIREMYDVLGIEAARQNILNEIVDVMEASDAYVNYHHLSILCDRMTVSKDLVPIYRSGILNDDIGPISKSTYEMHTEMFLEASRHGEFDQMRGVSANVMCGQQGYYGTNAFSLLLDMEAVMNMETRDMDRKDTNDRIEELFGNVGKADECSLGRIRIDNNVQNLQVNASGACGDDGYELF